MAELSDVVSVVTVITCFLSMVIFIIRMQGFDVMGSSVVHVLPPSLVQINLKKVEIPFACVLDHHFKHKNEIELKVAATKGCMMNIFWGASLHQVNNLISASWNNFKIWNDSQYIEAIDFEKISLNELEQYQENESFIIKISSKEKLELGKQPREKFPLVITITKPIQECCDDLEVGALISIFHLSDEYCPKPSCLLFQYLKYYSGKIVQLNNLYTQSTEAKIPNQAAVTENVERINSIPVHTYENSNKNSVIKSDSVDERNISAATKTEDGACIICQAQKATHALLPCRHVCVCQNCFPELNEFGCPLCRSRIQSYFIT